MVMELMDIDHCLSPFYFFPVVCRVVESVFSANVAFYFSYNLLIINLTTNMCADIRSRNQDGSLIPAHYVPMSDWLRYSIMTV